MASRSKAVDAPEVEANPLLRLGWLVAAVIWCLVVASMVSYDPSDAPGHAQAPLRAAGAVANWIGPVGAGTSHHLFQMLGVGAWMLVLGAGAWLAHVAWRGPVGHALVRGIGLVLVAVAVSGFHALLWPGWSRAPEGAGGMLAIVGVHELTIRFGSLGAALWLITLGAVGLTVAFDRWLIVVPAMLGESLSRALGFGTVAAGHARSGLSAVAAMRAAEREDGERAGRVREFLRSAARRGAETDLEEDYETEYEEEYEEEEIVEAKPKKRRPARAAKAAPEPELEEEEEELEDEYDAEYEEDEYEDEAEVVAGAESEEEEDEEEEVPANELSEEALREKIAKLPVRFAGASKKLASEDDLEQLRAQRASEEEADRNYTFPGLDLLTNPEESYADQLEEHVREQARALEHALATYKIDGHVAGVDSGPVITLYQVALAPGTKVSSVTAVSSDLARMLRATNVRIVPNTEGLDTIGIEVPNRLKEKVRLKELMALNESTARMKLPLFLGKDASGAPLIVDLAGLPHMLIAGTTGSGKSVCMNAIIMGFLYTQKPSDLKLVLVDPKMVELSQFRDIPHLMCPVVTEMGKAAAILEWAVTKMDERYELLAEAGCRDITAYNSLGWEELRERLRPSNELEEAKIPRKLPYLVFVIDELADLMMTNKEVETSIVRIAQKARAVGIHLILATQRPQANVVTGLIKSNMPGRVSFKVASAMDSRIVMDQKGGELLLGQGDMLMLTPRSAASIRAQGTLVDDQEIRRVVRFIRDHAGQNFEGALEQIANHGYEAQLHEDRMRESAQEDPLFDRAVELVLESGRGSVSMLQRRLAIGYTRSARLIEMMGEAGIIGGHKGTVAREVNMTVEEWQALKQMAEGETDAEPAETLFGPEEPEAREAAPVEREALGEAGIEARADEDGGEVSLVDTNPSAADRFANTDVEDEHRVTHANPELVAAAAAASAAAAPSPPEAPRSWNDVGAEPIADEAAESLEEEAELEEAEVESVEEAEGESVEPEEVLAEAEDAEAEAEPEAEEEELVAEEEEELEEEEEELVEAEAPAAPAAPAASDEAEVEAEDEDEEWDEEAAEEEEPEAELEEEEAEGEEEEEYEYEYVDEDGNPIDESELEEGEEYEYVEDEAEEEEPEAEAEPEPKAVSEPEPRSEPEIRTRPVGWRGAGARTETGA